MRPEHLDTATPPPARSLWRHADFMKLWGGQTVSQLGSQVTMLALPLTAILLLRATPLQVGILAALEFVPFLVFGLPSGAWADRLRRRPILIAADAGRALVLATVPLAYAAGALGIGQLYAVAFVAGTLTVFFDVAHQSYLPSLIDRGDLVDGNAKLELSSSAALLAGPGLGGILVQLLAAPLAILVDAVSFVCSALLLLLIRRREPAPPRPDPAGAGRWALAREVWEGVRYVAGHDLLLPIGLCTATINLFGFGGLVQALLVLFAVRDLHLAPGAIGLLLAAGNAGVPLGALAAGRLDGRVRLGVTIVGGATLMIVSALLVPLATPGTAVPVLALAVLMFGFGSVIYNVNQVSLRQAITPERMQGRMNATMRFMVWGTIPIGSLLGGALASAVGLRATLWLAAVAGMVAVVPLLLSRMRALESIPAVD